MAWLKNKWVIGAIAVLVLLWAEKKFGLIARVKSMVSGSPVIAK